MRIGHFTLFSLFFASRIASANWTLNLTPGVTPISHDIYQLHMTILWICVAIGIVVFGVMFYAIIHHRKSQGAIAAQFHEHLWVELTWSIIPFVILVVMAIPATRVLIHIRDTEQPELTVKITGYQWKWRYEYLGTPINFFSNTNTPFDQIHDKKPKDQNYLRSVDHPLVLPIHKKIRLLITSNDVIHSWWVPDLGTKQDATPGFIIESWTRINRAGTYHGQCAELCGVNHAYMPIVVTALPEKDFNNWIKAGGKASMPVTPVTTIETTPGSSSTAAPSVVTPAKTTSASQKLTMEMQMQKGEQIYNTTCAVCHQPSGEGLPPTYPALKQSPLTKGPVGPHMNRVLFGKPGTAMQAFKDQFNDEDLSAVITYERNAWGNNKGDVIQPEEVKAAREKGPLPE